MLIVGLLLAGSRFIKSSFLESSFFEPLLFFTILSLTLIVGIGDSIDIRHDGYVLKPAAAWILGKVPFRDEYSFYNLGNIFINGMALKIFGVRVVALRIFCSVAYALIGLFQFLIWNRFISRRVSLLAVSFWFLLNPFFDTFLSWSSVYALCCVVGGDLLYLKVFGG